MKGGNTVRIIEIVALENGAHRNQTSHGEVPEGWAVILSDREFENYPFGNFEVEEIDGVPHMIEDSWEPLPLPEPEPEPEAVPTESERIAALEEAMLAMMMGGMSDV